MLSRRDMIEPANIRRPLPIPGIQRSGEHEIQVLATTRWLEEEVVDLLLTIGRVGPHVTERRNELGARLHPPINIRVDAPEERTHHAGTPTIAQFAETVAAGP